MINIEDAIAVTIGNYYLCTVVKDGKVIQKIQFNDIRSLFIFIERRLKHPSFYVDAITKKGWALIKHKGIAYSFKKVGNP